MKASAALHRGLFHALNTQQAAINFAKTQMHAAPFEIHPFGLDTRLGADRLTIGDLVCEDFYVLAHPGHPDPSVQNMTAVVKHFIETDSHSILYFRQIIHGSKDHGFVYFEVGTRLGIYMCGGCTTDTNAGGEATKTLNGFFTLAHEVLGVPYEDIFIKCQDKDLFHKRLLRDWESNMPAAA